jgi:hypothetical protein
MNSAFVELHHLETDKLVLVQVNAVRLIIEQDNHTEIVVGCKKPVCVSLLVRELYDEVLTALRALSLSNK